MARESLELPLSPVITGIIAIAIVGIFLPFGFKLYCARQQIRHFQKQGLVSMLLRWHNQADQSTASRAIMELGIWQFIADGAIIENHASARTQNLDVWRCHSEMVCKTGLLLPGSVAGIVSLSHDHVARARHTNDTTDCV